MSKMKELDEIAQGIAGVTKELMYDSIDWQLADFPQDGDEYNALGSRLVDIHSQQNEIISKILDHCIRF
jgi:hypothetical protein